MKSSKILIYIFFRYENTLDMNFCLSRGKNRKIRKNWNRLLNNLINTTDMTIHCRNRNYDLHQVDLLSDRNTQPCIISGGLTIDLWK